MYSDDDASYSYDESDYDELEQGDIDSDGCDVDELEDREHKLVMLYNEKFETEDSVVRRTISDFFSRDRFEVDEPNTILDLNHVLSDDEETPPEGLGEHDPNNTESVPPSSLATVAVPPRPLLLDGSVQLKESTATKRLRKTGAVGVLYDIPAEESMNRKALQEWWALQPELEALSVPMDQLFVGYRLRLPVGVGLTIFANDNPAQNVALAQQCVAMMQARNGRLLSVDAEDDIRPFYSESSLKPTSGGGEGAGNSVCVPHVQRPRRPRRNQGELVRRMQDPQALQEAIDACGGLANCRFITIDVEAAVVHAGAIPLPLEIAIVDCGRLPSLAILDRWVSGTLSDDEHQYYFQDGLNYHLLVHPGQLRASDEPTAMTTSTAQGLSGWHEIPFRHYDFLRRDYIAMTRSVHWILSEPGVIVLNKGSTMDVHAIRWLYAAANLQYETYGYDTTGNGDDRQPPPVPTMEKCATNMFDIKALQGLFKEQTAAAAAEVPVVVPGKGWCWYHSICVMLGNEAERTEVPHCAMDDAWTLAHTVAQYTNQL